MSTVRTPSFSPAPPFYKPGTRGQRAGVAFQVSLQHVTEQGEWKFLESRSFSTTASIITFQNPEPKATS